MADENGRTGIVYQSTDHSLVNDLLKAGEITEEEAKDFPQKNVITRAMQPHLERRYKADIYNIEDVKPGDYFFLCCDGVLEQLTNEILGTILSDTSLDDKGKIKAIKSVCDDKTKDNYTCWLIPIDKVSGRVETIQNDDEVIAAVVENNAEQNIPTEICTTINVTPIKKRKKFIPVILIAFVCLCLIFGGWFAKTYFAKNEKKEEPAFSKVENTEIKTIPPKIKCRSPKLNDPNTVASPNNMKTDYVQNSAVTGEYQKDESEKSNDIINAIQSVKGKLNSEKSNE